MKITNVWLLIIVAGGWLLVLPVAAQTTDPGNIKPGSIQGTVIDIDDDPVADATVILQGPTGSHLTVVTKDDGAFAFHDVTPGSAYQITVTAEGFAEWSSS